jgi:hypothetical protein
MSTAGEAKARSARRRAIGLADAQPVQANHELQRG